MRSDFHNYDLFSANCHNLTKSSPLRRCHNRVHHFDDPVQSRVRPDRHVSSAEVIVDGAHHTHDVKGGVFLHSIGFDQTWNRDELNTAAAGPELRFFYFTRWQTQRSVSRHVDKIPQGLMTMETENSNTKKSQNKKITTWSLYCLLLVVRIGWNLLWLVNVVSLFLIIWLRHFYFVFSSS